MANVARRIGANMASAAVGKGVIAVAGMATVAVMARQLGADGYGVFRTALTFVSFAATFANLGLNYILLREVAVDERNAERIVGAALSLRLLATIVVLAIGFGIACLMPWTDEVLAAIAIAAVGMLAYQGNELITCVLQWRMSQQRAILAETIGSVVALLAAILAAWLGVGVLGMTGTSSLGLVITFLLAWYLASRLGPVHLIADRQLWLRLAGLGLPIAVSAFLTLVSLRGDTLLLSIYQPAEDVGLYGIATKIYEVGLQLPVLFGGLLMPLFSRAVGDARQFREHVANALHALIIIGIGIVLTMWFFAKEIIVLLAGPGFAPGSPSLQIMGICLALAGCSAVLRYAVIAQGRQAKLMIVDAVTMVLALTAYFTLIPRWSFMGAAFAKLGAEVVTLTGLMALSRAGIGSFPLPTLAPRALLAGALTAGVLIALRMASLNVLIVAALGGVTFVAALLGTGALSVSLVRKIIAPDKVA